MVTLTKFNLESAVREAVKKTGIGYLPQGTHSVSHREMQVTLPYGYMKILQEECQVKYNITRIKGDEITLEGGFSTPASHNEVIEALKAYLIANDELYTAQKSYERTLDSLRRK